VGADDPVHFEGVPLGVVHAPGAHTLGKYRLIAKLARGGMGVLYLAVLRGPGGFHKLVAVKELRPELADDEALVTMFVDEARLAAQLNHPNIVQTMEVGVSAGRHFMAMEYLEGQSLQRLTHRAQERGTPVPLAIHLGIAIALLDALEHAHQLTGLDGTPLGVVHRDVSPHNVLITYEGQIKLVDFGIAKTHDGLEGPLMGVPQGKTRYMAPEQAACGPVDPRADLFSVGVILWEAIVGRRPWEGRPDNAVLESLVRGAVPRVHDARPDVDPDLAAIVDRAMSGNPEFRYRSALEMREDLDRYMSARSMTPFHTRALSALITRLFADDRERLRQLIEGQLRAVESENARHNSSVPPAQLAMSVPVVPSEADAAPGDGDERPGTPPPAAIRAIVAAVHGELPPPSSIAPETLLSPPPAPAAWSKGLLVGAAAALGASVALVAFSLGRSSAGPPLAPVAPAQAAAVVAPPPVVESSSPAPAPVHVVVRASPPSAQIFLDDEQVQNPYVADRAHEVTAHGLRVEAPGYETKTATVTFEANVDVAIDLALVEPPPPPRPRSAAPAARTATPVVPSAPARSASSGPRPIDTGNPYGP
jgi:serine/threonine-protein kinase